MNVTLDPSNTAATDATVALFASVASATIARRHHMPSMIPKAQLYYWTRAWQEGEAEALDDLAAGRSRVFNDPRELARYLLRPIN